MKKLIYISLAVFVLLSSNSCDLDDAPNIRFTPLRIVSADLPDAFELFKSYEINVTYINPDNCTFFEGFDISRADQTTRNVVVIGSVLTGDRDCAEMNQEVERTFIFEVLYEEPYLFRFWTGENEADEPQFLEVEVPVIK